MKCVINKKTKEISRVTNEQAEKLVKAQTHEYINKKMWKTLVRDKNLN